MKYLLKCLIGIIVATVIVTIMRWMFVGLFSITSIPAMIAYTGFGISIILIVYVVLCGAYVLGDGIIELIKSYKE